MDNSTGDCELADDAASYSLVLAQTYVTSEGKNGAWFDPCGYSLQLAYNSTWNEAGIYVVAFNGALGSLRTALLSVGVTALLGSLLL